MASKVLALHSISLPEAGVQIHSEGRVGLRISRPEGFHSFYLLTPNLRRFSEKGVVGYVAPTKRSARAELGLEFAMTKSLGLGARRAPSVACDSVLEVWLT